MKAPVGGDLNERVFLRLGLLVAIGSESATPCCSSGAMIIMMISSTSMTSTSGVTLMSDLTSPLLPPTCIAMIETPEICDVRSVICDCRCQSQITNHRSQMPMVRPSS
jgi:hypothetical protein